MSKKKIDRLIANLARAAHQFISGKRYSPMTFEELIRALGIPAPHERSLKQALEQLMEDKQLKVQEGRYVVPRNDLIQGTISVHPRGFGFVKTPEFEVFIPKHAVGDAVDGDTVEIAVSPNVSAKGPEGEVVAILKRSRTHLAGILTNQEGGQFTAYSPLLGPKRMIRVQMQKEMKVGDRVILQVLDWRDLTAKLDRVLGHITDASIDIPAAIEEFELPGAFMKEAVEEARGFGTRVTAGKERVDLTELETVTIDPETAKDFDDAISLSQDERGHFHLGVHIADVAHYVKAGSYLDQVAKARCNSTYFPGFCLPMLPEELSNELCSLKPKVKRLTVSVLAEFTPQGDLVTYKVVRAVIKSQKRFSYGEALEVLEGKAKSPHAPLLDRMVNLCKQLKRKRFERGSIDFGMPETVLQIDKSGVPTGFVRHEYDITHQMIEEFMLKANELVAIKLSEKTQGLIYRVHEEPSADTFEDFYSLARALGFFLPPKPTHRDIQGLFEHAKGSPHAEQLSVAFIRSMKLAAYSPDNLGHYGLALAHYCHFTSPIRRYTDLIIERLLFGELPLETDLTEIAAHCSERERVSFKAESSVKLLKKLRYAETQHKADPNRLYEAKVVRVKPHGLIFEVPDLDLEGMFHISDIGNDYYEYNEKLMLFRGSRTGEQFRMGDPLTVRLDSINLVLSEAKWSRPNAGKRKR